MALLDARPYFKPFDYPWAFQGYELQQKMHWLPSEVPLHEDVKDWTFKLSQAERNLLTQIFRFFTQGDIDVAAGYIDNYLPAFKAPEVRMMLTTFASMEAVHVHAYSLLLDTVGMPETEYQAFQSYREMTEKHAYLFNFSMNNPHEIAKTLAAFIFAEGVQLFSSFVILLNFSRHNKMKGMSQIVTWSVRDESLHVEYMTRLFRTFVEEYPHIWQDAFKAELYGIARKMVELEDAFIDLAFAQGGIEGLTADEVKQYIRFIADRRLLGMGLKPNYGVKDNPLPWLDWVLNGIEHTNFFENRSTEYAKGNLQGSWAEVWGHVVA